MDIEVVRRAFAMLREESTKELTRRNRYNPRTLLAIHISNGEVQPMKVCKLVVSLLPFVVALSLAGAQSSVTLSVLQCGMHQVRVGETKLEVLERCGEPRLQEAVSGENQPHVEQWLYKQKGHFTHILTFAGTVLIRIQRLPFTQG